MNEGARDANEAMHRQRVEGLLNSIDKSLRILVERSNPAEMNISIGDLSPEEAEVLSRGLADLNAGRVTPFDPRSR